MNLLQCRTWTAKTNTNDLPQLTACPGGSGDARITHNCSSFRPDIHMFSVDVTSVSRFYNCQHLSDRHLLLSEASCSLPNRNTVTKCWCLFSYARGGTNMSSWHQLVEFPRWHHLASWHQLPKLTLTARSGTNFIRLP